jgi:hypothetical protein
MNGIGKNQLVRSLCRLAAHHCSYSKQPCDCKYIQEDTTNIASMSEEGSGCPELTVAAMLISQLSTIQYEDLCKKSGVTISEETADVLCLIADFQKKRLVPIEKTQDDKAISRVRCGGKGKSAYVPAKLPKGVL